MKYVLVHKSKFNFVYCEDCGNYISEIEISTKNTKQYKGTQVICYQKGLNSDGYNNAVGLRRNDLLRLPFMILHFKLYRLFGREQRSDEE